MPRENLVDRLIATARGYERTTGPGEVLSLRVLPAPDGPKFDWVSKSDRQAAADSPHYDPDATLVVIDGDKPTDWDRAWTEVRDFLIARKWLGDPIRTR